MDLALHQIPQQVVNGLVLGSMYALIALGYTMVYGILEMINFAHGDVYMAGAFLGWGVTLLLVRGGFPVVAAGLVILAMFLVAMLGAGLLGVTIERLAYRPLRGGHRLAPLISALGVSIFLENIVSAQFGARAQLVPTAHVLPGWQVSLGSATVSFVDGLVVVVALGLMVALDRFVRRTRYGTAMRATAQDREAAGFMGIRVNQVIAVTFLLGSALAGIAGILAGLLYTEVDFFMGYLAGLKAFTAAVLGRIGNIRGAVLGGLLLGMVEAVSTPFVNGAYVNVVSFLVLILVLLIRPSGLLGEQLPDKV
ncbi:MAG TPA: branched-chain amino acid ABC transporter permease [Candidatus Dormibacteraeota bacterium]|nr:branched-chain amino acid ABC transporter permease [Candidatus Dormibacteraeota bacterium]